MKILKEDLRRLRKFRNVLFAIAALCGLLDISYAFFISGISPFEHQATVITLLICILAVVLNHHRLCKPNKNGL